jgi:hypothetical protein
MIIQKYGDYQLIVQNNFGKENTTITVYDYNNYRYINVNFNFLCALKVIQNAVVK